MVRAAQTVDGGIRIFKCNPARTHHPDLAFRKNRPQCFGNCWINAFRGSHDNYFFHCVSLTSIAVQDG